MLATAACSGEDGQPSSRQALTRPPTPALAMTYTDWNHALRAMGPGGILYAIDSMGDDTYLFASTDNGRSFQMRARHPEGASFANLAVLSTGTLIADAVQGPNHSLWRSADGGWTWWLIMRTGMVRMLHSKSIGELRGSVFFGEYQVTQDQVPVRLWRSMDDGATFQVVYTFWNARHIHAVIPDWQNSAIWVLLGDETGGIWRSLDWGQTFIEISSGPGAVAVDALPFQGGLLYGRDALFQPNEPGIVQLPMTGPPMVLSIIAGPSYSILRVSGNSFLVGETREPDGDIYAMGDDSAHLYGSLNGRDFIDLMSAPRTADTFYGGLDAIGQLPSGEVVVAATNLRAPTGQGGSGFFTAMLISQP
jgi:hypothetical protein